MNSTVPALTSSIARAASTAAAPIAARSSGVTNGDGESASVRDLPDGFGRGALGECGRESVGADIHAQTECAPECLSMVRVVAVGADPPVGHAPEPRQGRPDIG